MWFDCSGVGSYQNEVRRGSERFLTARTLHSFMRLIYLKEFFSVLLMILRELAWIAKFRFLDV